MTNEIITQKIKILDEKVVIDSISEEIIDGVKTYVYYIHLRFTPMNCIKCGQIAHKTNGYYTRTVKTFINYDYPILLQYRQRVLKYNSAAVMRENNNIVSKNGKVSKYLKLEIIKACSQKNI